LLAGFDEGRVWAIQARRTALDLIDDLPEGSTVLLLARRSVDQLSRLYFNRGRDGDGAPTTDIPSFLAPQILREKIAKCSDWCHKSDSRMVRRGSSPLKEEKESLGAISGPHIQCEGHSDFRLLCSDLRNDRTDMHVGNKS
jgi:hypothetical protein